MGKRSDEVASGAPNAASEQPSNENQTDEIETTRAQIQETRSEMADTIDAIEQKLSPQRLQARAKENIKQTATTKTNEAIGAVHSAVAKTRSTTAETLNRHTVPLAIAGVAIAAAVVIGLVIRANQS